MINADNFAVNLAQAVEIFRDRPDAKDEQKAKLRTLVALSTIDAVTVTRSDGTLGVAGATVPDSLPSVRVLIDQLRLHQVESIEIDRGASPRDLFDLLRLLALAPDQGAPAPAGGTVRLAIPEGAGAPPAAPAAGDGADVQDLVRDDSWFASMHMNRRDTLDMSLDGALAALEAEPYADEVLSKLTELEGFIHLEAERDRGDEALRALASLVSLEAAAPSESSRRAYAIVLNRLLQPKLLTPLVHAFVEGPPEWTRDVLGRSGSVGAEMMIRRLTASGGTKEAQQIVSLMDRMEIDAALLSPLLTHKKWYIAQWVASLIGELRLDQAVPGLADASVHPESAVRNAAMDALAKMGTPEALKCLRDAIASGDADRQAGAAAAVGRRRLRALVLPLTELSARTDVDAEVRDACYTALGRIGSPDAVRALVDASQPGGTLIGRKSARQRVAAVSALQFVEPALARKHLERLAGDKDKQVRAAAEAGLEALGKSNDPSD